MMMLMVTSGTLILRGDGMKVRVEDTRHQDEKVGLETDLTRGRVFWLDSDLRRSDRPGVRGGKRK